MKVRIAGRHHDTLRGPDGSVLAEFAGSNRVVLRGLDLIGALLAGHPPVRGLGWLAVGSGDAGWGAAPPEPPLNSLALTAEVFRQPITADSVKFDEATGRLTIQATIAARTVSGTLREFGVFGGDASARPGSGYLFGYRRHAPVELGDADLERRIEYDLAAAGWLRTAVPVIAGLLAGTVKPPGIRYWAEGSGDAAWDTTPPAASRDTSRLANELYRARLLPVRDLRYDVTRHTLLADTLLDHGSGRGMLRETGLFGGEGGELLVAYQSFNRIDKTGLRRLHRSFAFRLSGTENARVPETAGVSAEVALGRLAAADLVADPVVEVEDVARAGTVIETVPASGIEVPRFSRVQVRVGVTPLVDTPGVLGLWQQDAAEAITAAGLTVGTVKEIESEVLAGSVLEQKPAGGVRVPAGSAVRLAVSTAPLVTVPSVIKLHTGEAEAMLASVRLRIAAPPFATEQSDLTPGVISSQVPAAGVRIQRDSSVAVTLAVPRVVKVPNVVGMAVPGAVEAIKAAGRAALRALGKDDSIPGLAAGKLIEQPSTIQPDSVLAQDPAADVEVALFSTINLTVAVPAVVTSPVLVGLSREAAAARLAELRLTLRASKRQQSSAAEGTVIDQDPAAGLEVPVETPFDIAVAAPLLVTVPSLTGMLAAVASEVLRARGLVLGPAVAGTGQGLEGTIVAQNPAAGAQVRVGAQVIPTVIGMVNVPNVTGLDRGAAAAALSNAALVVAVQSERSANKLGSVIRQTPAAGTRVRFGSTVTIVVAEGVATPAVVGMTSTQAQSVVQGLGLAYVIATRKASEKAPDTVLAQSPAAQTVVPLGTQVQVDLASGVAVPVVTGLALGDAESAIERIGLKISVLTPGATKDDRVATQSPAAGSTVGLGSAVQVTTVDNLVAVPNVRGRDAADAVQAIESVRLVAKQTFKASAAAEGTVIAQTPVAGTRVRPGTVVTITVSIERIIGLPRLNRPL